jgi:enoyl-CoA hydratase/carnithine racemase
VANNSLGYRSAMTGPVDFLSSHDAPNVVEIVLNRPERRNALTGPLAEALAEGLHSIAADPEVSVLILRGAGGAFCSGLDLKEFGREPAPGWITDFPRLWREVHEALYDVPCIVVGALERAAVNGGASLALACDFLVVGDTAFLQVGEIQQGMAAPMNMAWLRLRHSEALAARVALLGDRITGPELVDLGLATASVADDRVLADARRLATRLATHDAAGVRRIKHSLRATGPAASAAGWFDHVLAAGSLGGGIKPRAAENR